MTLNELNNLSGDRVKSVFTKCCGSTGWVSQMIMNVPFSNQDDLFEMAENIWFELSETDWLEAFTHHPKIGDIQSLEKKFAETRDWAGKEQSSVKSASRETIKRLAHFNEDYERKFGFIFIVCATGKSANEMLKLLESRRDNNYEKEIRIAMKEQHKITSIRLNKLLS